MVITGLLGRLGLGWLSRSGTSLTIVCVPDVCHRGIDVEINQVLQTVMECNLSCLPVHSSLLFVYKQRWRRDNKEMLNTSRIC